MSTSDSRLDAPDSMVGLSILGQFRIIRVLARGGMSQVYLAEQSSMDRYAAVKIVRPYGSTTPVFETSLRQEARTASRLVHPHIITVYNCGELADGSVFLAMEYVKGQTLAELLTGGPLPLSRALLLARQCASALAFAHGHGVVHRDFKPGNVILADLEGRDHIKVLDFGMARVIDETFSSKEGEFMGTPRYMSPEQCRGEKATPLSDQYALGLVLYEMVTGRSPVEADCVVGLLRAHQLEPAAPPSRISPAPGVELVDPVVLRMLEKDPARRFPNMDLAGEALHEVAARLESAAPAARRSMPPANAPVAAPVLPAEHAPPTLASGFLVAVEGNPQVLTEAGWQQMRQRFTIEQHSPRHGEEVGRFPRQGGWLVATSPEGLGELHTSLLSRGVPLERTLVCVDVPLEAAAQVPGLELFGNLVIGPYPLDPTFLAGVVAWMSHGGQGGLENVERGAAVQLLQITSSSLRSVYVDKLLQDVAAGDVRRPVQRAVAELSEEMILNAIFHAPRDRHGKPLYSHLHRSTNVVLRRGEEPVVRWFITRQLIGISVRDTYGSLTASDIFAHVLGAERRREASSASGGAGLGLRIMSRAAQHLIFAICPGTWTEIVALVPQATADRSSGGRAVCVLHNEAQRSRLIGDRLRLREVREPRRRTMRLELAGEINETSDLKPLFQRAGRVRVDMSQVTRLNSVGLRAWLVAAGDADPSLELILHRCSPPVVSQINMVPSLTAGVRIESILGPFYCPLCKTETLVELMVEELRCHRMPSPDCGHCGGKLQFDEVPEEYFAFLR